MTSVETILPEPVTSPPAKPGGDPLRLPPSGVGAPVVPIPRLPRVHLAYLDGLRALAALYVLVHHAWMISTVNPWSGRVAGLATIVLARGHVAVDLFIVLSGFCLMLPVSNGDGTVRGGAMTFFRKRARRILPPYYFALLLSLILALTVLRSRTGTLWDLCVPVSRGGVLSHLLLVHELFGNLDFQINGVFWSVAVEWKIYFLFPLLVVCVRRWGAGRTCAVAVALGYALLLALRHTPINTHTCGVSAHYVGLFAMGMLAAQIVFARSAGFDMLRRRVPWMLMLGVATVLCLAAPRVRLSHEDMTPFNDFFVGLWSMTLLVALGIDGRGRLHRAVACRPLAFIGTFAYSIYLVHLPLLQICWQYGLRPLELSPGQTLIVLAFVAGPMTLALAYVFFLACERPFLNRHRVDSARGGMAGSPKAAVLAAV